jgi:hypothetical protein
VTLGPETSHHHHLPSRTLYFVDTLVSTHLGTSETRSLLETTSCTCRSAQRQHDEFAHRLLLSEACRFRVLLGVDYRLKLLTAASLRHLVSVRFVGR